MGVEATVTPLTVRAECSAHIVRTAPVLRQKAAAGVIWPVSRHLAAWTTAVGVFAAHRIPIIIIIIVVVVFLIIIIIIILVVFIVIVVILLLIVVSVTNILCDVFYFSPAEKKEEVLVLEN